MSNIVNDIITGITGGDDTTDNKSSVQNQDQTGTVDTKTNTTQNQNATSQTGSVSAQTQDSTSTQSGQVRSLSGDEINAADKVLGQLSTSFSPADLSQLSARITGANDETSSALSTMLTRALGAEDSLNSGDASILAAAKASGTSSRDSQFNQAAAGAGSAFNTLTQQVFSKGENDLDVQLAGLGAQLASTNRQQATAEIVSAVDALQKQSGVISTTEGSVPALAASLNAQNSGSISALINSIKGGLTTSNSTTDTNTNSRTENQSTTNSATQTVTNSDENKNVDLNTGTVTVGSDTTSKDTNLIDLLNALKD